MDENTKKRHSSSLRVVEGKTQSSPVDKSDAPKKRKKTKNAFEVMMKAARSPQAFLTSLDDSLSYLKRNPTMREIIGVLIRQEESEKDANNYSIMPAPERNSEIQQWMDRLKPLTYTGICSLGADDCDTCPDGNEEDDDSHKKLPASVTDPSPNAISDTISVHVDFALVKGFTMTYTDGLEIIQSYTDHGLQSTTTSDFQLERNEYISAVTTLCQSDGGLVEIRFVTTSGRCLIASGMFAPIAGHEEKTETFKEGRVLHGIKWGHGKMVDFSTVPLNSIDEISDESVLSLSNKDETCKVPTLQQLAYDTAEVNFKNEAKKVGRDAKATIVASAKKPNAELHKIQKQHELKLQTSPEAAFYRLTASLVAAAKFKLAARAQILLESAEYMNAVTLADVNYRIKLTQHEWANDSRAIYDKHRRLVNACMDLSGVPKSSRKVLCFTPECRNLFQLNKVTRDKRCTHAGCVSSFPNCGCSIAQCRVCHKVLCALHLKSHQSECECIVTQKYGYCAKKDEVHRECFQENTRG